MELLAQQIINGIALGSIYALFAVGFSLILAKMGVLNVAHGTFATWGCFGAYWLMGPAGLSFWLALVGGTVFGGLIGVVVDLVAFEPLRRRKAGTFAPVIASIGVWIVLLNLAQAARGPTATSYPAEKVPQKAIHLGSLLVLPAQLISVVALVVVVTTIHLLLTRTRFGWAVRAVAVDPRSGAIVGVNARLTLLVVAFLAAAIAGLAGVLSAYSDNNVVFNVGEGLLLKGFAAVVVGGFDDVRGTAIAGICLGIIEVFVAQYISTSMRDGVTYTLLLMFLIMRPRGLFGSTSFLRA